MVSFLAGSDAHRKTGASACGLEASGPQAGPGPRQLHRQPARRGAQTSARPRPRRPPAVPPSIPRAPGGEPLRGPRPGGLRGWAEGDDEGAAAVRRSPGRPPAAAADGATATKRLPRQADFTDPARAVTQRRGGRARRPQTSAPQAVCSPAPGSATGRPSGRRTQLARVSRSVGRSVGRSLARSGWTGRCQPRPSPGASAARDRGSRGADGSGSGEARHGDPLQPEEPGC